MEKAVKSIERTASPVSSCEAKIPDQKSFRKQQAQMLQNHLLPKTQIQYSAIPHMARVHHISHTKRNALFRLGSRVTHKITISDTQHWTLIGAFKWTRCLQLFFRVWRYAMTQTRLCLAWVWSKILPRKLTRPWPIKVLSCRKSLLFAVLSAVQSLHVKINIFTSLCLEARLLISVSRNDASLSLSLCTSAN